MRMKWSRRVLSIGLLLGLLAVTHGPTFAAPFIPQPRPSNGSKGMAAIDAAAQNGKYLFIYFWKNNDEQSKTMSGVFQAAMKKCEESADSIGVQITDPKEKAVVAKFDVSRAPMPLVIALAPNGAITKGFPVKFTEQQLQQGFVSPGTANSMKALQEKKLVLLCVQNKQTQNNAAASKGVSDFKADKRYAKTAEVVTIDPADQAEGTFLQALKVDPRTPQAVTVLLAPPGKPIARFVGAVTKNQIAAKVAAASSACGAGCACHKK